MGFSSSQTGVLSGPRQLSTSFLTRTLTIAKDRGRFDHFRSGAYGFVRSIVDSLLLVGSPTRLQGPLSLVASMSSTFHFRLLVLVGLLTYLGQTAYSQLLTLNVTGEVLSVDPESGMTTPLLDGLGSGSWSGLATVPGHGNVAYAVQNPRPTLLSDPQLSRLSMIDLTNGDVELFDLYGEELGSDEIFSSAIAISELAPEVAVVVGNDRGFPPRQWIWKVGLPDGRVVEPARELEGVVRIESLAYTPGSDQLWGTDADGLLVNIDYAEPAVSVIGDPVLSNFITGLAFDPATDILYAIEGSSRDRLVTLSPNTGALLSVVGPLGIKGPEGLAFLSPNIPTASPLDCDASGVVDSSDLECSNQADVTFQLLAALHLLQGDLDGLNGVGFNDFLTLSANFGQSSDIYTDGDINDDGVVGFADFLLLSANFGRAVSTEAAVPEPTCQLLVLLSILPLACLRKQRDR